MQQPPSLVSDLGRIALRALSISVEKCVGCRICETVCAASHFKVNNPSKGAIRLTQFFPKPGKNVPISCRLCGKPPCVDSCPTKALGKLDDGRIQVDTEKCIGCRACADSCPFGAIFFHTDFITPIICDLCDGDPQCARYCPSGAISFMPTTLAGEANRLHYAIEQASRLEAK